MTSLREFLDEKAERLQAEVSKAQAIRAEWVEAVARLRAQIRAWIAEADTGRILRLLPDMVSIHEEMIGDYRIDTLSIELGPRRVRVEPIARFALGPLASTGVMHVNRTFGRVDLTNGLEKRMLFRTAKHPDGPWIIVQEDGYRVEEFNQRAFEVAIQSLFE